MPKYEDYKKSFDFVESNQDYKRVVHNLNVSRNRRVKKVKDFLFDMLSYVDNDFKMSFLTLTFSDQVMNSTTERARRVKVNRYLQKFAIQYVANIDFGGDTGREHYHAIVLYHKDYCPFDKWEKNGFYTNRPVAINDKSMVRLSNYINKLSYHAIKDTTQHDNTSYRLIYWTRKPISDII